MKKRNSPLADAFGIDADELGSPPDALPSSPAPETHTIRDIQVEAELPEPTADGIVRMGNMEFVQLGSNLLQVHTTVQVNLSVSALEKHKLLRFSKDRRMSMVEVVRASLEAYYKQHD